MILADLVATKWNGMIQFGYISLVLICAELLRIKIRFIRKGLIPTAVIAGLLILLLKVTGLIVPDAAFLENLTYHGIAIGFIAMSLRVPDDMEANGDSLIGLKSGAIIASTYVIQGIAGLVISLVLALTFMPTLFPASGILLPMGFGQGPGQANNVGTTFESLGFAGGRSFGLSIAAAGFLVACFVGVFYNKHLIKSGKVTVTAQSQSAAVAEEAKKYVDEDEPLEKEPFDRLTMQLTLVFGVYFVTCFLIQGICALVGKLAPSAAETVSSLLWGFNFLLGSVLAMLFRVIMRFMRKKRFLHHRYQNNYLLNRITGVAFDFMITAGIASIDIEDISGLLVPFILMVILGTAATFWHLSYASRKVYPEYYYEGLMSMFGMLTGTISSGVLLLRQLDPDMKSPAGTNLVLGSSFAVILGAPILLLVTLAPRSFAMSLVTLGILLVYYLVLLLIINLKGRKKA